MGIGCGKDDAERILKRQRVFVDYWNLNRVNTESGHLKLRQLSWSLRVTQELCVVVVNNEQTILQHNHKVGVYGKGRQRYDLHKNAVS